ncbi:hypothetical protein V9T40_010606 [Parthenolecanium corni]|uniref:U3 small nucleolar RNA-associated protein 13 C-terminal domain-containing protein n=1 Tax=Parthenolecanium corni TaxID=536013 RepID=A0AAN9XYQ9_9HEMI
MEKWRIIEVVERTAQRTVNEIGIQRNWYLLLALALIRLLEYGISKITLAISNCEASKSILIYKVDSNFTCLKQMTGYLDEILALTFFGEEDEYLVVASNSSHLNVYDRNMNCSLLKGHSDCIICLATSPGFPNILVSGRKDHSVWIWMCKDGFFKCVASVTRHRASVGAVVSSHNSQDGKIINASEDQTLTVWKLPALKYSKFVLYTIEGHDCSVLNCAFFNNGTQIVSCGNDGLVKVWTIKNNECVSILDRHASKDWAIAVSSDENKFLTVLELEQLLEAPQYAITLYRPLKVFKIVETLSGKQTKDLETVIGQLNVDQKETIVKYASEWNKNSRSNYMAQDNHCLIVGSDANVDSTSGDTKETLHRSKIICESSAKNGVRENVVREYVKIFIPADREEAICNQTTKPQTVSDQVVPSNFSVRQRLIVNENPDPQPFSFFDCSDPATSAVVE